MNQPNVQLDALKAFWRKGFGYEVVRSAITFFILAVLGYVLGRFNAALSDKVFSFLSQYFSDLNLETDSGSISALALFASNARACLLSILYGLIPFLYLPALSLGMNSMLLGVLGAYFQHNGYSLLYYFAGTLPHGILEIPALIVSFAMGLYLCKIITRYCRKDKTLPSSTETLTDLSRVFVLVVVPLLAVAAVIEAYLTPIIANHFL